MRCRSAGLLRGDRGYHDDIPLMRGCAGPAETYPIPVVVDISRAVKLRTELRRRSDEVGCCTLSYVPLISPRRDKLHRCCDVGPNPYESPAEPDVDLGEYFDEIRCAKLDPKLVRAARMKEIYFMQQRGHRNVVQLSMRKDSVS